MRYALYGVAALAAFCVSPFASANALAAAAAALTECVPFLLAGRLVLALPVRWNASLVPFLGCGCGTGPAARSLPAAAATWIVFGPLVAAARVLTASLVARFTDRRHCAHADESLLAALHAIVPCAILGGAAAAVVPLCARLHASAPASFAAGAAAAFALSPCALGAIGLAGAIRSAAPAATAGFLCVAGVFDLRAFAPRNACAAGHDALAYALLACACTIVAVRHGAGIVHPLFALALWPCAIVFAALAWRFRAVQSGALRAAPLIVLAGTAFAVPPPQYHATATTLGDAFAGERIDFTGAVTRTGNATTLVRYAITCCRADASPIVVRIAGTQRIGAGWARARGVLVSTASGLQLRVTAIRHVPAPADPFVYR